MLRSLGAFLLAALAAGGAARAETRQAEFVVQATVPARATLLAVEQPNQMRVTEDDLARGYKDVSARYVVASNTPRGWLLNLAPRLGVARQVEVRGLSTGVVLANESAEVYQPRASEPRRLALQFRFVLRPDLRPGSYELPIHVSATPL